MILLAEGEAFIHVAKQVGLAERHVRKWAERFIKKGIEGLYDKPSPGRQPVFSPEVALHLVKIACEMPDRLGVSLS
jgi:transposase